MIYTYQMVWPLGLDDLAESHWGTDEAASALEMAAIVIDSQNVLNHYSSAPVGTPGRVLPLGSGDDIAAPCEWQVRVWEGDTAEGDPVHVTTVHDAVIAGAVEMGDGWERVADEWLHDLGLVRHIRHDTQGAS